MLKSFHMIQFYLLQWKYKLSSFEFQLWTNFHITKCATCKTIVNTTYRCYFVNVLLLTSFDALFIDFSWTTVDVRNPKLYSQHCPKAISVRRLRVHSMILNEVMKLSEVCETRTVHNCKTLILRLEYLPFPDARNIPSKRSEDFLACWRIVVRCNLSVTVVCCASAHRLRTLSSFAPRLHSPPCWC